MKTFIRFASIIVFLCAGCTSKIELEGDVFVEKDGVATKLANTEIQLVSELDFVKFIKTRTQALDAEISRLNAQIAFKEAAVAELNNSTSKINKELISVREVQYKVVKARPNAYTAAVLAAVGDLPGVAEQKANEKLRYLYAQMALGKQLIALKTQMISSEISHDILTLKEKNMSGAAIDESSLSSLEETKAKINAGKISVKQLEPLDKKYGGNSSASLQDAVNNAIEKNSINSERYTTETSKLKESIEGLKSGRNAEFYYSKKIPNALFKTATNSDGHYSLKLESKIRTALVASTGKKYWFLWVSPESEKRLDLSNLNSVDTNCDLCIFNLSTTPQSL